VITLYYHPGSANLIPHILLEELGVSYARIEIDRANNAHKSPEYLRLNPNGSIPVLTDGDLVLYETAAICLHLVDTHPTANMVPPLASTERAHFYKWLMWLTNTLQPALMAYFYPDRWVDAGDAKAAAQVKHHAELKTGQLLDQLDAELARHGGPWFGGARYSALDPYVFVLCRWTRGFDTSPARTRTHLGLYLQRMLARPGVQRGLAAEGLTEPWV
jgi:glutathione S-transferase